MDSRENEQNHTMTNEGIVTENGEVDSEAGAAKDTPGKQKLRSWLNRYLKIKMTDGRILTGAFLCTDRDANVILGLCSEYLPENSEARALGLVMVPGRHIVTIQLMPNVQHSAE
ncbi:N-alpha-acetyltransferase 38-B, NatC auxiliary subunit [Copidosoma floridanum]|uniref:N-alpha-acetyltransferase 38-B, NatC auxiliary subunit n=1 Tax=Copidosoma floridanum TaxID=29053 RepID=UPI0006C9C4D3|nr:N-alpha-acetyltransferase 38-B, NatC auxiliary subunit [Copidosoma floridanum]